MLKYAERVDQVFHALGDPTRRLIVEQLSHGPASLSQLAEPLPMSLPAVHQHVAVLEASGLVTSLKVGRVRTCRLQADALTDAQHWIEQRRVEWEQRLDRLSDFLESLPPETPPGVAAPPSRTRKQQPK
jgi:DNA-binding transcriptional ArsR family regulator